MNSLICKLVELDWSPIIISHRTMHVRMHMFHTIFSTEYDKCFPLNVGNPLTAKLFNLNFHPLEVVSR